MEPVVPASLPPPWSSTVCPIGQLRLEKPPSCIQFVPPTAGPPHLNMEQYFIVGTYELVPDDPVLFDPADLGDGEAVIENTDQPNLAHADTPVPGLQSRNGSLILFRLEENTINRVTRLFTFECPSAVYDFQFLEYQPSTFAAASDTGTVSFYNLVWDEDDSDEINIRIQLLHTHTLLTGRSPVITYLSELRCSLPDEYANFAATTDDGGVYLLRGKRIEHPGRPNVPEYTVETLYKEKQVTQFTMFGQPDRAWCSAFFNGDYTSLFSGGDNGKLYQTIFETPWLLDQDGLVQQNVEHTYHDAGVCAILPLPAPEDPLILTGSYDCLVRLYCPKTRKVLAELNLGGGIYRLKFMQKYPIPKNGEDREQYLILACCTHVGAKVLLLKGYRGFKSWAIKDLGGLDVLANKPDNVCYAGAVRPFKLFESLADFSERLIITATFTDHKLVLWKFDPARQAPDDLGTFGDGRLVMADQ